MKRKATIGVISAVLLCTPLLAGLRPGNGMPAAGKPGPHISAPVSYEFHTIDVTGSWGAAYGLNDTWLAVGGYLVSDSPTVYASFLWRNGVLRTLDHQSDPIVDMEKVNNWGWASGGTGTTDREDAALYLAMTGTWTLLPPVTGKPFNFCMKVNDVGIAVGQACEGTPSGWGNCVSWMWNGRSYSFIPVPPGNPVQYTGPLSINNWGEMVGQTVDQDGHVHPYLQQRSKITFLDYPGAQDTYVNDINNQGEIILDAWFANGQPNQNYIWRKGMFTPLPNYSDGVTTYQTISHGLNDHGDFSGTWIDANGVFHPFVAVRKAQGGRP